MTGGDGSYDHGRGGATLCEKPRRPRALCPSLLQDTDGAFRKRRELVKLLIEKTSAGRGEGGRVRVDISYRFSPPEPSSPADGLDGVRDLLRSRHTLKPTRMKK
jgi:hypothetical protein